MSEGTKESEEVSRVSTKPPCLGKGQGIQQGPALRRLLVFVRSLMSCSQQESSDASKGKDTWTQPSCRASVWSLPAEQQRLHLLDCWSQCHPAGACLLMSWQNSSCMACVSARVMCRVDLRVQMCNLSSQRPWATGQVKSVVALGYSSLLAITTCHLAITVTC